MFGPAIMVFCLVRLNGDKEGFSMSVSIVCAKKKNRHLVSAALSIRALQSQLGCILPRSFARKATSPKLCLLHISPSFPRLTLAFLFCISWSSKLTLHEFRLIDSALDGKRLKHTNPCFATLQDCAINLSHFRLACHQPRECLFIAGHS